MFALPVDVHQCLPHLSQNIDADGDAVNPGGRAPIAADFTGEGWRTHLDFTDSPVMESYEAGQHLAELAARYDFSFFEYWPSDYAGHRQDKDGALKLLESFDSVLGGLLDVWDDEAGLVLVTSDHGNMEDMSTRRHTLNPVPALVFFPIL